MVQQLTHQHQIDRPVAQRQRATAGHRGGKTCPAGKPGGDATPLAAFNLAGDTAVITALSNDIGIDVVFSRQLAAFGRQNDIAVGLSTSGNSANLLRAFDEASRLGMLTIGFSGYAGGKMAELDSIDYLFVAPSSSVHRIQEAQTTVYNILWELTLAALGSRQVRG